MDGGDASAMAAAARRLARACSARRQGEQPGSWALEPRARLDGDDASEAGRRGPFGRSEVSLTRAALKIFD